ncbi:MAG: TIGR00645 family protein [Micrococcales bacterium]|nr:TIGR00645 family protein [Micrococcales bacterium]
MSRWLQAPLYLGLIVAQAIYVLVFTNQLWHLGGEVIAKGGNIDGSFVMLAVLELIDVVMVANLLIMVIIGGYETFVSRLGVEGHPDEPDWLSHVNANLLKVKLAVSIISISSIHLLKTFIEVGPLGGPDMKEHYTSTGVMWQVLIHLTFVISACALGLIDWMQQRAMLVAAQIHAAEVELHHDLDHDDKALASAGQVGDGSDG